MPTEHSTGRQARRSAFFGWAAILSLFFIPGFIILTAFTIGLWLAQQNAATTPVGDLGFLALGAILIGLGCAVQLRAPARHVAGMQQVLLALLALVVAGLLGARVEPLVGGMLFLVAAVILAALHPARRRIDALGQGVSAPLVVLALLAVPPAVVYAVQMLILARQAGASCFLGHCAQGDRLHYCAQCCLRYYKYGYILGLLVPSEMEARIWTHRSFAWSLFMAWGFSRPPTTRTKRPATRTPYTSV
jgi:hypothetical protein